MKEEHWFNVRNCHKGTEVKKKKKHRKTYISVEFDTLNFVTENRNYQH